MKTNQRNGMIRLSVVATLVLLCSVMRALGANRRNILMIILTESSMLGMLGLGMGWVFGHGIIGISAPYVDAR